MGFLNSAFLIGLAAVSIPLILHFLSRRRITTIEFSSLRFLEQMQKSRMKWLKIKEILLLLLRMVVIALIVMAFARPTLRGFVGSSKGASSVAILLDRSASMEAQGETGSLFDEARRTTARLVSGLDRTDKVAVIPFPSTSSESESYGPLYPGERLQQNIGDISMSFGSGGLGGGLKTAFETLAASSDLNKEIYIISDFQKNAWNNMPSEVWAVGRAGNIHLSCVAVTPSGPDNIGITGILLPPQMIIPGENFQMEAELVNYGSGTLENVLVGVIVEGERKAQSAVSLRPGQPTSVVFAFKLDKPGNFGGYIEIDYDRYSLDNKRYFTIDIPDRINLLAVGQSKEDLRFLSLALDRPEAGQIRFKGIGAADLLREDPGKYKVILLHDLKNLDPAREAAVRRFAKGGGALFLSLGRSSDISYWNKFLDGAEIEAGQMTGDTGEYIIWDKFDFEHPIFSIYARNLSDHSGPDIADIHVFNYAGLKGGRILGSTSGGVNLLAESRSAPIIVFGSGLDINSGDLPAHTLFLPLLARSVEYLGSRDSRESGDGILGVPYTLRIDEIVDGLKLTTPSGKIVDINPSIGDGGATLRLTADDLPGIYELTSGEKTVSSVPFNVDPDESSEEIISSGEIGELLGLRVNVIEPGADLVTSVKNARFGRELWKEFLLFALILLIMESFLGKTSAPPEGKSK